MILQPALRQPKATASATTSVVVAHEQGLMKLLVSPLVKMGGAEVGRCRAELYWCTIVYGFESRPTIHVCGCVRASARARVCLCVRVRVRVCECVCVCVCGQAVRNEPALLFPHSVGSSLD